MQQPPRQVHDDTQVEVQRRGLFGARKGNDGGGSVKSFKSTRSLLSWRRNKQDARNDASVGRADAREKQQMAAVYREFGDNPAAIIKVECDDTVPKVTADDHVLIKVQASTVSLGDCLIRRGLMFDLFNPIHLPVTPGHDVVGHVVACGKNVTAVKMGDRVAAMVRTGGNARFTDVPASSIVKVPRHVDSAEAAAMITIYSTAYQVLKSVSNCPMFSLEGKKILIIGGMDAIGQALIQMCLKGRADVYATAPKGRHAYMRNVLGVTPVPEQPQEWLRRVQGDMDIVFDGICDADGLDPAYAALNASGERICFGNASLLKEEVGIFGAPISAHMRKMWDETKSRTKTIDIWESFQKDPETYKKNLMSLLHLLKWDKLKPHIARRIPLTDVAKAQEKLEQGEVRGIIVCLPWKRVAPKDYVKQEEEKREK